MMKRLLLKIKTKIYSESGASVVLALLFFAMCAMVGSVVLTAGSATAGRNLELTKDTQEQYTLESAARVLAKRLKGYTFSFTHDVNETIDSSIVIAAGSSFHFADAICKALISGVYKDQWINSISPKKDEDDLFPLSLAEIGTTGSSYEKLFSSTDDSPVATISLTDVTPDIPAVIKPVKVDVFHNGYDLGIELTENRTLSIGLDIAAECSVSGETAYVEFTFSNPTIVSGKAYSKSASDSSTEDEGEG